MKNEPNNVKAKAAPIKRIDGSKVCKDGAVVFTTAPGHKIFTGGIFAGEEGGTTCTFYTKTHVNVRRMISAALLSTSRAE